MGKECDRRTSGMKTKILNVLCEGITEELFVTENLSDSAIK